jgi:hypothetical protein
MVPTRAMLVWCLVGTMALMTIVSFTLARLTVDVSNNPWLPLAITSLLAISFFYRYRRPDPHLCAVTEAAAQMLLILLFGILLTYAAMATNFPYRDAELYAIDRALGLDRRAYLDFVNSRPLLAELAGYCYQSLLPQFALVPMVLMIANQLSHLRRWMIAFGLALIGPLLFRFLRRRWPHSSILTCRRRFMRTSHPRCTLMCRHSKPCGPARFIPSSSIISKAWLRFRAFTRQARSCSSGHCARCLSCAGRLSRLISRLLPQRRSTAPTTSSIWWAEPPSLLRPLP